MPIQEAEVGAVRGNSGVSQTQQKHELTISGDLCHPVIITNLFIYLFIYLFMAVPAACRDSQARD